MQGDSAGDKNDPADKVKQTGRNPPVSQVEAAWPSQLLTAVPYSARMRLSRHPEGGHP